MSDESTVFDPYDAVIADLKAKRDQIDQAIAAIEATRGGGGGAPTTIGSNTGPIGIDGPGAFLGLSIPEAAKKLLAAKRQPLRNADILAGFKAGGFVLGSKDPLNTIGAVLTRRANDTGDIIRVGRGIWGLKEWFPGRFKKTEKVQNGDKVEPEAQEAPKPQPAKEHWKTRLKREKAKLNETNET
ncbi:MAG: winged helix-turn-helix domain-containing protein [Hyphomicrobiales bacterium]